MTMVSTKVKETLRGTIPRAKTLRSTVAVHGTTQQAQIGRNRVIWITLKRIPYRLLLSRRRKSSLVVERRSIIWWYLKSLTTKVPRRIEARLNGIHLWIHKLAAKKIVSKLSHLWLQTPSSTKTLPFTSEHISSFYRSQLTNYQIQTGPSSVPSPTRLFKISQISAQSTYRLSVC